MYLLIPLQELCHTIVICKRHTKTKVLGLLPPSGAYPEAPALKGSSTSSSTSEDWGLTTWVFRKQFRLRYRPWTSVIRWGNLALSPYSSQGASFIVWSSYGLRNHRDSHKTHLPVSIRHDPKGFILSFRCSGLKHRSYTAIASGLKRHVVTRVFFLCPVHYTTANSDTTTSWQARKRHPDAQDLTYHKSYRPTLY